MSTPATTDENLNPEMPKTPTISTFTDNGLSDGPESPEGYTHPAYYYSGPLRVEKTPNILLDLFATEDWDALGKPPPSPIVGHPPGTPFWPSDLEYHYRNQSDGDLSLSLSPLCDKITNRDAPGEPTKPARPKSQRMWSFRSVDRNEERIKIPPHVLYDREIELWRSDIMRNGPSLMGVQDGLRIIARKMGQAKPDSSVLAMFGAYVDQSISKLVDIRDFYADYHHHVLQRENEQLNNQNKKLACQIEKQTARLEFLEDQVKGLQRSQ